MSVRRQYKSRENTYLNATRCRSPPFLKMYSLRNQPFADSIYRPNNTTDPTNETQQRCIGQRENHPRHSKGEKGRNTTKVYQDGEKHP